MPETQTPDITLSRLQPRARAEAGPPPAQSARPGRTRRRTRPRSSLVAQGEPMIWLTGGALAVCLIMIVGLLLLVVVQGGSTFWPAPIVRIQTTDGRTFMGEVTRRETYRPAADAFEHLPQPQRDQAKDAVKKQGGQTLRQLVRTGNFDLTQTHFHWVSDFEIDQQSAPPWAMIIERMEWGRFYGFPKGYVQAGKRVETTPQQAWAFYEKHHDESRQRWRQRRVLETDDVGDVNAQVEEARLSMRRAELRHGRHSPQYAAAQADYDNVRQHTDKQFARIRTRINELNEKNQDYQLLLATAQGQEKAIVLADVVRMYGANRLTGGDKLSVYLSRWWEFLSQEPREANSEGGVFPAIFGTVVMTLIMCVLVVPFGVLAALYLREYAKAGPMISAVRIAINNLAGVPSIVFGVFGLGFFCYVVGASIDQLFFEARLPSPTFGKGALVWASFTLALLTLPVVIVATEEALAAVPNSMREGSYACGASKWQTIRRIVMPRAMPGIMTGMILAMARGAGEVAPLMLVGAVKLAPKLPFSTSPPFGADRSFMHLGFHIYDLGFQSQNSEAAKSMVFTTTLLLIALIAAMNLSTVWLRTRLRRRFAGSQF